MLKQDDIEPATPKLFSRKGSGLELLAAPNVSRRDPADQRSARGDFSSSRSGLVREYRGLRLGLLSNVNQILRTTIKSLEKCTTFSASSLTESFAALVKLKRNVKLR